MKIKKIKKHDLKEAFSTLKELRKEHTFDEFIGVYKNMQKKGCVLFAMYKKGIIVSVALILIGENSYYDKKHLYIEDLVTKSEFRSKGYGKIFMKFLIKYAKKKGCKNIVLASGVQRKRAHKFYLREKFYKALYVFKKVI